MTSKPGVPTAKQALLVFLAAFLGILGVGAGLNWIGAPLAVSVLAVPGVTLFVAVAAIRVFRLDPYRVFLLRPAKNAHLLLAFPVALALFVVSDQLANLSRSLIPLDEGVLEAAAHLVRAETLFDWVVRLAGIGFGAAVSEELLFRGVLLSGLSRLGRVGAILVTALLFTAGHGLLLPNYFVAGVVLGVAAAATGSILVPIAVHFFHNITALLLFNLSRIETLGDPLWTPPGILVPAVLILALGLGVWIRHGVKRWRNAHPAESEGPAAAEIPAPPPESFSLARDLRFVPRKRRTMGFLVLAIAMAAGILTVTGLFGYLGYMANGEPQRAAMIESLQRISHDALAPAAAERSAEIDAAFQTLSELNREGRLGLRHIWRTARVVGLATVDGAFDEADVEDLLMTVGGVRSEQPGSTALPSPTRE